MALSDARVYTDITIFRLGSTDYLGTLRNARVRTNTDAIELRAGKETRPAQKAGYTTEVVSGEMYMTTTNLRASIGTLIAFTHDIGGKVESGTGLLTSNEVSWSTGDAEGATFEIAISGTPTLAS